MISIPFIVQFLLLMTSPVPFGEDCIDDPSIDGYDKDKRCFFFHAIIKR